MDEKQIAISISTKLKDASTKELKDYADQLSRIQAFSKGLDKGALKQIDSSADGLKDNNKQLEQITKKSNKIVKLYNELLAHYLSDDEE